MPFLPVLAIPRTRPAPTIYWIMAGADGRFWSATMERPEMIPFRRRSSIYERDTYRAPNCKSLRQTLVHSGEQSRSVALDRIDWELRDPP